MSLLIIDNDSNFKKILQLIVKGITPDVFEASDGNAAIEIIKKQAIGAIISDYELPNLNGLEFVKYLKEENINIPVIWLTKNVPQEILQEAWSFGVYDFFTKPVDSVRLKECINSALNFGRDFNSTRSSISLSRIKYKEVHFLFEDNFYQQFSNLCLENGTSVTSRVHYLISKELGIS